MGSDARKEIRATSTAEPACGAPATAVEMVRKLLLQVAVGDRAAFAELYDLTVERVYELISAALAEPDRADALIDIYVDLWRTTTRVTPEPDPARWVSDALAAAASG